MNYYNTKRRKKLPNKKLDIFLSQLQNLYKKHKMMLIDFKLNSSIVETYDPKRFKKVLTNLHDNTTPEIEEELETEKPNE